VHPVRLFLIVFGLLFLSPLSLHAAWWLSREHAASWDVANWASADLLPPASAKPEALVHVYAARVGRWRGIFAHHSWIVIKERGATSYTRFDVVGWGQPLRTNLRPTDAGSATFPNGSPPSRAAGGSLDPQNQGRGGALSAGAMATTALGRGRTPTRSLAFVWLPSRRLRSSCHPPPSARTIATTAGSPG
jgi:hypothetical protein